METTYLELHASVGVAPSHVVNDDGLEVPNPRAGEPDALNNIGIHIPMPVMIGDDVGTESVRVEIVPAAKIDPTIRARILPGTRIVETDHPAVVNTLLSTGHYHQVDKPSSEQPRKPKPSTEDEA